MLSTFVEMLRVSLATEFGDRPWPAAFATPNGLAGHPLPVDVRMVICRKVEADGSTLYCSDGRSNKNWQLVPSGGAAVAFWLPIRREQFRIRGRVDVIRADNKTAKAALRAQLWTSLSDATRATFFWPAPGTPRVADPALFPAAVNAREP